MRRDLVCKVLDNERLRSRFGLLRIEAPSIAAECEPGQFVMLRCDTPGWPYLSRPFSIYGSDGDSAVEIVYKVVGRATGLVARMRKNDAVEVTGPLGTRFSGGAGISHVIAVAGGIGLPPLGFFCRRYGAACERMTLIVGAATRDKLLVPVGLLAEGVEVLPYTEDGSKGSRGTATDGLADIVRTIEVDPSAAAILACGPKEMLSAVHGIAQAAGIACEVSVEEVMACGLGACMSCAIPASGGGYLHACKDGPVVPSFRIDFARWVVS